MLGIDSSNGPAPDNRFVSTFKISFNHMFYKLKVCTESKFARNFGNLLPWSLFKKNSEIVSLN